jgi:hypothetical protein
LYSPFVGTSYGNFGGYISNKLESRALFDDIPKPISVVELSNLLLSINPATRLMAAEYYFNNFSKLSSNEMNKWVVYSLSSPKLFDVVFEDRSSKRSWFEALELFVEDKEVLVNFKNSY